MPAYSSTQAGTFVQSIWAWPWVVRRGHPKAPLNSTPGSCTPSLATCQPSTSSRIDSDDGPSLSAFGKSGAFHRQVSQLKRSTERS